MQYHVETVDEYLSALPANRRPVIEKLHAMILANLPDGFEERIAYGMISFVVPLSRYPQGYHAKKYEPLPFLSLASQKNHIALYHLGLYADKDLESWFLNEYTKRIVTKIDYGKSCIRFKNLETIPYDLIAGLCQRMSVDDYIRIVETSRSKKI